MQTIHSLGVYVFIFPSLLKCVTTVLWSGEMNGALSSGGKGQGTHALTYCWRGLGLLGPPPNKDLSHHVCVTT